MDYKQILIIACIIVTAILVAIISRLFLNNFLKKSTGILKVSPTNYSFLKHASHFLIFLLAIIAIFYTVPELKGIGKTLFAGAGIFAAIMAFASQQAFSNIISGIFIIIFKPFRVGDLIEVKTDTGVVEDITLRHTVIKNFENKRIIIPNSVISSETIINRNIVDPRYRRAVDFSISYDSDIDKAINIIKDEARKHKNFLDWRTQEDIENGELDIDVKLYQFADSAIILRAFIWSESSGQSFDLMCDLNYDVKKRFDAEGISIPFPHRTIINRS